MPFAWAVAAALWRMPICYMDCPPLFSQPRSQATPSFSMLHAEKREGFSVQHWKAGSGLGTRLLFSLFSLTPTFVQATTFTESMSYKQEGPQGDTLHKSHTRFTLPDAQQVFAAALHGLHQQLCQSDARARTIYSQETKVCWLLEIKVRFKQDQS